MAVYFTLESSHRMLVTLWFGSYMVGFPANLWEVYHPIPFPLIAPGAHGRYFRPVGWEARRAGVEQVKYILRSP
jgi:hypothetical protein